MIILGLLLILGVAGLSFALWQANETVVTTPVGTVELLGRSAELTAGEVFLSGTAAGALVLISLVLLFSGMSRSARRRPASEPVRVVQREKEPAIR